MKTKFIPIIWEPLITSLGSEKESPQFYFTLKLKEASFSRKEYAQSFTYTAIQSGDYCKLSYQEKAELQIEIDDIICQEQETIYCCNQTIDIYSN